MKSTTTLSIAIFLLFANSNSQTTTINEIGFSQLFIWNKSTVYDTYSGARSSNKTGLARSHGTNFLYSHGLSKSLFANISLGHLVFPVVTDMYVVRIFDGRNGVRVSF